jgi:hypothetical protein
MDGPQERHPDEETSPVSNPEPDYIGLLGASILML